MNIKKSYENFSRDLDTFIEINIKGIKPKEKKKESINNPPKHHEGVMEIEKIFSIHNNLCLLSENTQFEKFLEDTNFTYRIRKTLKNISKLN